MVADRFGLPSFPFLFLGLIVGAATVYLCRDSEPLEKAAAITLGSLLASPYAIAYDLIAVLPFLAVAVFNGRIFAALATFSAIHPLPVIISLFELVKDRVRWRAYA